ncbi:RPAP2-Rtr1 domain-containing protein [Pyrenophora tritici-repentis]|nr:RPAP2-Rtr1 domain-containing protein [Pyrenophora tritici-repentis]
MQPKSILKKTTVSTDAPPGRKPVNPRHLAVARHHATVLEDRKRVETEVLEAVMILMDFPTSPNADPKRPSPDDALFFQKAVIPFQPADYDALIEERNIADKCGYALCSRPKKKARSTAKKQFIDTKDGVQIVDRKVLEVWCSDDCAKRALYVKVQLNEEPAWLRSCGYGEKIELMVENSEEHRLALPLRPKQESATKVDAEEEDMNAAWAAQEAAIAHLALERGEKPGQATKANSDLIQDQIVERVSTNAPPLAPSLAQASNHTMAIEGHVPRINRKDKDSDDDKDDEDDGQNWDKHLPG